MPIRFADQDTAVARMAQGKEHGDIAIILTASHLRYLPSGDLSEPMVVESRH